MSIGNRYEFMFYLACQDANPNGDPDMANMPRVDPETMIGYITDVAIKRNVRDYVDLTHKGEPGMDIMVQSAVNLNRKIAEAKSAANVPMNDTGKAAIDAARAKACEIFYDNRTHGAVLTTGPNAGQVRGPVQIAFARSVDPVCPTDIGITRVAKAIKEDSAKTVDDYLVAEGNKPYEELRGMGRKQFIPFGLYEVKGFISANFAAQTGFDERDLEIFFEALANMYDTLHSASKGMMSVVSPVIIFKHVGDKDKPADVQAQQAKLGRAPAHKLFELVSCKKKPDIATPTNYTDYACSIAMSRKPKGIEIGFLMPFSEAIVWNELPADETWLHMS